MEGIPSVLSVHRRLYFVFLSSAGVAFLSLDLAYRLLRSNAWKEETKNNFMNGFTLSFNSHQNDYSLARVFSWYDKTIQEKKLCSSINEFAK